MSRPHPSVRRRGKPFPDLDRELAFVLANLRYLEPWKRKLVRQIKKIEYLKQTIRRPSP